MSFFPRKTPHSWPFQNGSIKSRFHQNRFILPFDEAREAARGLGVTSAAMWRGIRKERPSELPSDPEKYYKTSGFVGFPDFFGYSPVVRRNRKSVEPGLWPTGETRQNELAGLTFFQDLIRENEIKKRQGTRNICNRILGCRPEDRVRFLSERF